MYGTDMWLNPTALMTTSIYCVTLIVYCVYLMTQELRSDRYRLDSN